MNTIKILIVTSLTSCIAQNNIRMIEQEQREIALIQKVKKISNIKILNN